MKSSRYNVLIPYKNAILVYNILWNKCIMVQNDNIRMLSYISPSVHQIIKKEQIPDAFVTNKMVVTDEDDEIEICKQRMESENENCETYILTINPTLSCNFRCWYCYENHERKNSRMSSVDVDNITNLIRNLYHNNSVKHIMLNFFGGEPLLGFNDVMQRLIESTRSLADEYRKKYSVAVTTNAYLLSFKVVEYLKDRNTNIIQVTLDGNRDVHDKVRFLAGGKGSYDRIVKNIKYAVNSGQRILLRLNISENTGLDVPSLLHEFEDLGEYEKSCLAFYVQKVWQAPKEVQNVVDDIIRKIRKQGFQCQKHNMSYHTVNNTCYADKRQHLVINPGGKIHGCTARDFSEENVEGQLFSDGHVEYNEFHRKRLECSPFNNAKCRECKILPICIGGCKQKQMEAGTSSSCIYGMTEQQKDEYARKYVMEQFI